MNERAGGAFVSSPTNHMLRGCSGWLRVATASGSQLARPRPFVVWTSWLFVAMTALQLSSALLLESGVWRHPFVNVATNLACNALFVACYVGNLAAYCTSHRPPSRAYCAGTALYTCGYFSFAAHFGLRLLRAPGVVHFCNAAGSSLFLVGSVLLVSATALHPASSYERLGERGGGGQRSAPLFAGSSCFLLGSIALTSDALLVVKPFGHLAVWGLAAFLPGRVLFLLAAYRSEAGGDDSERLPLSPDKSPDRTVLVRP